MNHILIGISQPVAAERMLRPLVQLSRRLEAAVTVLRVVSAGPGGRMEQARQIADWLAERLSGEGVDARIRSADAGEDPAGAILDAADEVEATLLVLAINGKSQFARVSGGDIPTQLLRRTHLPVLLLPPGEAAGF